MSSPDYDRIIAREQQVLASIKGQGERLIPEFKRIAAAYVRDLSITLLKSYFQYKPEISRTLGTDSLAGMKREFTDLLDSLPAQTSQRLDDSQIWLHRVDIPDRAVSDMTYSYQLEKSSNKSLDDALRELIGLVGSILMKYGFVEAGKDFTWNMSPGGLPHYANDLPSKGMEHYQALTKLKGKYKDLLIEYVYAVQNLRKAEQARKSARTG